ncbi:MAG: hypothetical protein JW856_00425 [Dehalococcoidales bacterium]|nr:hypothetical protein [Dehalococcoidales bacterium]
MPFWGNNRKQYRIIIELFVYFIFIYILWGFLTIAIKDRLYLHLSFYVGILASIFWWAVLLSVVFLLNRREKLGKTASTMRKTWPLFLVWLCGGIIGFYALDGWIGNNIGHELSVFIEFGPAFVPTLAVVIMFNYNRIKNFFKRINQKPMGTNRIQ